jgi:hypothetical protein
VADDAAEGAELDAILLEESSGPDEGSADLELDQFQATEIREIFLTTLPEYLEPVRQMIDQMFSASGGHPEIRDALETTLSSIQTAALRVGIDDVASVVDRMRTQIIELGRGAVSVEDAREGISLELSEIERIASSITSGVATSTRSETIVSALGRLPALDRGVLEKLTAAGLVTVDQIRMADPGEIVAVSGLDAAVVAEIVRALAAQPQPQPEPTVMPAEAASAPPGLEAKLELAWRAQVELELSLEQARADLLQLRTKIAERRHELGDAHARREALRASIRDQRSRIARRLARLAELKTEHGLLLARQRAATERATEARARADALSRANNLEIEECALLARDLTFVTTKVGALLRSARARSGRDES